MIADGLMEDGICAPFGGEKWYPSTVASILENEKYAGDLLMQKWYVEDYLTHKCVKNSGEKPQYFVEDDHDPIVPKAVFYQVQGEKKREELVVQRERLLTGEVSRIDALLKTLDGQQDRLEVLASQVPEDEEPSYLDRVVVKDDGYEVAFKAGVTVEVEI